jgi:hypothetical protein
LRFAAYVFICIAGAVVRFLQVLEAPKRLRGVSGWHWQLPALGTRNG